MAKLKWIIVSIVAVLLIIAGILFYPITNISAENIEITNVKDVTLKGFTLVGKLYVNNPSMFTIPVKNVNYQLILEKTNDVLFTGTLPPFTLESSHVTKVPFTMSVQLRSTVNLALLMATQKQVDAKIVGTAQLDILGFKYNYPFESQLDLKEILAGSIRP